MSTFWTMFEVFSVKGKHFSKIWQICLIWQMHFGKTRLFLLVQIPHRPPFCCIAVLCSSFKCISYTFKLKLVEFKENSVFKNRHLLTLMDDKFLQACSNYFKTATSLSLEWIVVFNKRGKLIVLRGLAPLYLP